MASASKKITTNSIHSLEYFCELTQKAYAPHTVSTDQVLHSQNGWARLADLWEELIDRTDLDMIADILATIKWGQMLCKAPNSDYLTLVNSACEELLADTPAFRAWSKHYFFRCSFIGIAEEFYYRTTSHPYCHSDVHHWYVDSEMTLKLWKRLPGRKKSSTASARFIEKYQNNIIKLIPSARFWSADYWLDENHIHDELFRVHHVDYRIVPDEYHCLFRLISDTKSFPKRSDTYSLMYLCNLTSFSPSLVRHVWPNCAPDTLPKLFLLAEKRAYQLFEGSAPKRKFLGRFSLEDITYSQLHRSWLFAHIRQQFYSGNIPKPYVAKIKRSILNVELRH